MGFRGLTFEKSLKAFSADRVEKKQVNADIVYRLALEHLKVVESCCHTKSKFCCCDVWQGNLLEFVDAVMKEIKNDI